jgi:capsular exopolysaccharide synthesis family protein
VNEQFFDEDKEKSQGLNLDFKRVLSHAIRFWYVILISLFLAAAVAFYLTRYSERVYPVSASIIIREMQETAGAEILYKNALIDPYRNYLNEPYIIRSYPLIEEVVKNLNFHTTFYREGYFMTTEAYNYVPVRAELDFSNDSLGAPSGQFVFELRDEGHFTLKKFSEEEKSDVGVAHPLNQKIEFEGLSFKFAPVKGRELKEFVGVPFLLVIENPTVITARYINRLNVEWAEEGAGIINLSLVGTNPEKEIDFLNALIAEYRNIDLSKKNEAAERTIEFIKGQLSTIKDSLRTVEYQLERFGNNSRVKDMSADAQRLLEKAEGFELQKSELLIRQRYFQYLVDYLSKDEGNLDQIILPSSVGLTDPVLTSLISKMIDLQLEIKMNLGSERAKNPLITNKLERIQSIKKDVDEAVRTLRSTDKIKMDFINSQLKEAEKLLSNLPASERQLISVQRNYALLENLYVFLMQKLSEAGISKASSTSDIIPVNPPMRGGAISPKPTQNYALALLVGFALPLGFFVFFELLNNKVQSKEDIEKITKIPFIGGVGHKTSANNLIVSEKPKSGVAESFRALRSNLNYFTANKDKQVFMVTSSISGEGKTFTTINLATVFAMSGKRTLIVGADMRRPKIFDDFKCTNEVGLSTYLSSISEFEDIVQKTAIGNLFLVSGGPVPPNPSELLLTNRFEMFMKHALERFDFVLLDTPPLALVTDAFVMSKFADHTVFVMRQNYSPKDFVRSINEYYQSGKLKNISILLNDIYKSGLGYGYGQGYAYNYGYSYGYGYGTSKNGQGYYSD